MKAVSRALALLLCAAALGAAGCDDEKAGDAAEDRERDVAEAIARSRKNVPEAWNRKVILLGFDSCDADLVEDLVRRGKLRNFARMRREGAHGLLESAPPLLSPVVWTTIATGMSPERHGILDFVTLVNGEPLPVSSRMRTADTMWEVLARHGEQVGVVGWLVTYPADPLPNAFLVTDRMGLLAFEYGKELTSEGAGRTLPDALAAEVEQKDRVSIDDLAVTDVRPFVNITEDEYAKAYSTKFHPLNRVGNLRLTLATAKTFRNAGQRLYAERRPRFFACYFEAMDAISHVFMPYAPPKMPEIPEPEYVKYKSAIEANYVWHDQVLGEFMDLADADTTIFLVSDHGFKSGDTRRGDSSDFHAKTGAMWHRSHGVIYAWGKGVAPNTRVDGARTIDVAPTVLASMGYPKSAEMPGKVLTQIFAGGLPFEKVDTYFGESRKETVAEYSESLSTRVVTPEDQAAMERLGGLGYMGGRTDTPGTSSMNLGSSLMAKGRHKDALDEFMKVWEKDASANAAGAIAAAYMPLAEFDKAKEWAEKALELDPGALQAQLVLIRYHSLKKDLARAVQMAAAARQSNGDFAGIWAMSAELCVQRSNEAAAEGDIEKAMAYRAEAIKFYKEALRREPNEAGTQAAYGALLLDRVPAPPGTTTESIVDPELVKTAHDALEKATRLKPLYAKWHNNLAIAMLRLGMAAQASGRADEGQEWLTKSVASADRAIEVWRELANREYPTALANRAYALWALKRIDESAASAAKAREADPAYVFAKSFHEAMEKAGRPIAPPAPKPEPPKDSSETK